jgi:hypothetical protein
MSRDWSNRSMAERVYSFKVGQTVDLIPSTLRFAAKGAYQIVSLRPIEGGDTQYRVKSKSEVYERVVSESDLILVTSIKLDFD